MYMVFTIREANIFDCNQINACNSRNLPIVYGISDLFMILMNSNYIVLVIENKTNGNIIGYSILENLDDLNYQLLSIAVDKKYRKNGFGSKIIEYYKKIKNIKTIGLYVKYNNDNAILFYKKHGFKIKKFVKDYYQNLDCNDAYYMRLKI